MVDFIKITNAGVDKELFLSNPHLSFSDKVDRNTGELIEGARSAKYRDMRFFISAKGVTGMAGSLHKYYNEGAHNYNDFTLENLSVTIEDLHNRFGINPSTTNLNNVEFGVNLEVPFNPDDFISHLVTHNYTQFNIEKDKDINYAQVRLSQFIIKIYNKGLQFGLGRNLLRFEVKIVRMAKLAKYDILTLQDLLNPTKLQSALGLLLEVFGQIIYWDESIDLSLLPLQERELLRDGYNSKFWQDHLKKSGSNASKKFRRYQDLIRNFGNQDYNSIGQLISAKWNSLIHGPGMPMRDFTNLQEPNRNNTRRDITDYSSIQESDPLRDFTTPLKECCFNPTLSHAENNTASNTSSYNLSISKDLVLSGDPLRLCIVTGLDISMQKGTSRFLSTTGIRYYQQKDPEIFNKLLDLLTDKWINESLDKRIFEIAHSIRNSYHSKRIHTQKAIKRLCSTPALFNNFDLVCQQKKNIANQ